MRILMWLVLAVAASALVAACAAEEEGSPASAGTDEEWGEQSARVDEFMASFVEPDAPGGVVLVVREGRILHETGYGLANLENEEPITPESIFHLGSVGKQFTGMAIMMLAEEGKLDYDDPISQHLPELEGLGDEVTIRRLLHHTSGLPDYYADEGLLDELFGRAEEPTNQDALAVLADMGESVAEPGEEFVYNNTGYELLGTLIEEVSGEPFPDFMQRRIFEPLEMKDTFSLPNPARHADPRIAHSYVEGEDGVEPYDSDPLDNVLGSGSIYSTVGDMAVYDQALYTERLVKASTLAEAFEPGRSNDGSETGYGFGWDVGTHKGVPYESHMGGWLGFVAYYARFPEQQFSVIVLLNRAYGIPDVDPVLIADFYLAKE